MTTTEYQVSGMSCGGCENSVRGAVSSIPSVTGIEVSSETGRLAVTADGEVSDQVVAAVTEAGYEITTN